ncbi:hypothetical protein E4U14_007973, partial [Claviceps sp. LM454 group G7]
MLLEERDSKTDKAQQAGTAQGRGTGSDGRHVRSGSGGSSGLSGSGGFGGSSSLSGSGGFGGFRGSRGARGARGSAGGRAADDGLAIVVAQEEAAIDLLALAALG